MVDGSWILDTGYLILDTRYKYMNHLSQPGRLKQFGDSVKLLDVRRKFLKSTNARMLHVVRLAPTCSISS
jgi:hypothetical protein